MSCGARQSTGPMQPLREDRQGVSHHVMRSESEESPLASLTTIGDFVCFALAPHDMEEVLSSACSHFVFSIVSVVVAYFLAVDLITGKSAHGHIESELDREDTTHG